MVAKVGIDPLMAVSALHARDQLVIGELFSLHGIGCVAGKATQFLILMNQPPGSLGDVRRVGALIPHGQRQTF